MSRWWPENRRRSNDDPDAFAEGPDADAFLARTESRVANLRPGLQKQILWADPSRKNKTPYSLIYLHGFSASSGEIRPVPDLVARHLGANLYFARLTGHGTDGEQLGKATIEEWQHDVAEAIAIGKAIGQRIIIMATSTGAALATWALAQPQDRDAIAAAIFLSANYGLKARGAWLLSAPFARQIIHAVLGRTRSFTPHNDEHARLWTHSYPTDALLPMAAAMQLARRTQVEEIHVPALFLYSPHDRTVDPARILATASRWGGAHRLIAVEKTEDPSSHVIAGDVLSPATTALVTQEICDWLDEALPSRS